jgi:hypothetical protein
MKLRHGLGIFAILSLALVGCTGDTGPQGATGDTGPQGEQGEKGDPGDPVASFIEFSYQGGNGEACNHCHASTVGMVLTTNHTNAFLDLGDSQTNLYCLQCHTTGFNCDVNFGDTEIDPANCWEPDDGYSGYIGDETAEGAERRLTLEGVQCESCHGAMGPNFNAHIPDVSFATHDDPDTGESLSLCYDCHHGQIEEWMLSGHANAAGGDIIAFNDEHYATSGSCQPCHTSEGFIEVYDPVWPSGLITDDEVSFVGCPTCHDPHVGDIGGGNEAQLREEGPVELNYTFPWDPGDPEAPTMEGYGTGQLCANCHKGRRDNDHVQGQIENGYGHFGPHHSNQADMFIGAGSYEIPGYEYDRGSPHKTAVQTACVECHMVREVELHGELQDHSFHTFAPNVENCLPCHTLPEGDFDYKGVQTEIHGKLDQVAVLMGYADWDTLVLTLNADNLLWTVEERQAVYGAVFVYNSHDFGVHNSNYARSLLDNAIHYLESLP